ncbi:MAG: hypothetical protein HUU25_09615 [Candidatus Sumerlaeia bacterium]|nr:hypothetical protein [Candidatus Sumerlaeia bacterium]
MKRRLLCAVLAALTLIPFVPGQTASPGALASPEVVPLADAGASPEAGIPEPVFDLNQVNFRLMLVVPPEEAAAGASGEFEVLSAPSQTGTPVQVNVRREALLRISQIDRAVIRQDTYGLYHVDLHFTPADTEALASVTAAHVGRRVVWASRSNILADFVLRRRDTSGLLSLFYGNTPTERIENVLQILQVPYTHQVAEDLFTPESEADEEMLRAMQAFELGRTGEAMAHLRRALNAGGGDYPRRARGLLVLGQLYLEQGNNEIARQCFLEIRRLHQDFEGYIEALQGLRTIAGRIQEYADVLALNREIVERAGSDPRWADAALEAQGQIVQLEFGEAPDSPETRRDAQHLIHMLQSRIATVDPSEQFGLVRNLITVQLALGQTEEALRAIRSHLQHLPEDPATAMVQVTMLTNAVLAAERLDEGLTLLREFSERYAASHDVSSEEIEPVWDELQAAITQLTTAIEASREGLAPGPLPSASTP